MILKDLVSFMVILLSIGNSLVAQFLGDFKINQYTIPTVHIDKHKNIYVGVSSRNDTVLIGNQFYLPMSGKNFERRVESYFQIFNENQEIGDSFHFYGSEGISILGSYVDDQGNYYFALNGPDTIYQNKQMFVNPYTGFATPAYIFSYNINSKLLQLCKTFGNGRNAALFYSDEKYIYGALNFAPTAYIDSIVINNITQGLHELDILLFRMNKNDFRIEQVYPILGISENYPLNIVADVDQNIYLCTDTYSSKLIYYKDTISLADSKIGNSLYLKFSGDGKLNWYHKTNAIFYNSIHSDGTCYVQGNYLNKLNMDSITISTLPNTEQGFITRINKSGKYNGLITFDGKGDRRLNLIKPGTNSNLITVGTFEDKINETTTISRQCQGAIDAYLYFIDSTGQVNRSFYFQGDSTDFIEDFVISEAGSIMVLGYTYSDTLMSGKDTLVLNGHSKNYFIYEYKNILNSAKEPNKLNINIYPSPFIDNLEIEFNHEFSYPATCTIFNEQAQKIYQAMTNLNKLDVQTINWLPGIYIVQVVSKDGEWLTMKAIKM